MTRIARLPEVLSLTGLTRSTLYELIERKEFPRQVKLSARAAGWPLDEVEAWIEARMRLRAQC